MKLDVLCVRQDARSQISTTLLAAREKGRFAQSRFPDPLNGVKLAKGGFSAKRGHCFEHLDGRELFENRSRSGSSEAQFVTQGCVEAKGQERNKNMGFNSLL